MMVVHMESTKKNSLAGVMVSVFVSSAIDRGFWQRSGQDYKIVGCYFSAKYKCTLLWGVEDWLVRSRDNVSE